MSYTRSDNAKRSQAQLRSVEPPRVIAQPARLPELLFTSLTSGVFLMLMASVGAAAILYTQGG